ncbi:ATP-binding protein [Streptomyces uncialis]|uniref:ATP-binding protein n=1 Tax=Streptomyces uncialis TaxID=1048205 RepID=UPI003810CF72
MSALATRLVLVGKEEEVPFARRTIVERARAWEGSLDEETADTIRLIVSELVSNAVVHGEGPVTITFLARPGGLLIDVRDGALDAPERGVSELITSTAGAWLWCALSRCGRDGNRSGAASGSGPRSHSRGRRWPAATPVLGGPVRSRSVRLSDAAVPAAPVAAPRSGHRLPPQPS